MATCCSIFLMRIEKGLQPELADSPFSVSIKRQRSNVARMFQSGYGFHQRLIALILES